MYVLSFYISFDYYFFSIFQKSTYIVARFGKDSQFYKTSCRKYKWKSTKNDVASEFFVVIKSCYFRRKLENI